MESISDFWKSARERFTNPFSFAFIVAWFSYNWKITVALFFTDQYPIQYQSVYDFIGDELSEDWNFIIPLGIAVLYVLLIAGIRQLVSLLNIVLDKWGTEKGIKLSGGAKVPVDKYLKAMKKVAETAKALDEAYEQETHKDKNYNELLSKHQTLQKQYNSAQTNVNNLQSEINGLQDVATERNTLRSENGFLSIQLQREQNTIAKLRDPKIMNGVWRVLYTFKPTQNDNIVVINDGIYSTVKFDMHIQSFFYDNRDRSMLFHIRLPQSSGNPLIRLFSLRFSNDNILDGLEDSNTVQYQRIDQYSIEDKLNEFAKQREAVAKETIDQFRSIKGGGSIPNLEKQ